MIDIDEVKVGDWYMDGEDVMERTTAGDRFLGSTDINSREASIDIVLAHNDTMLELRSLREECAMLRTALTQIDNEAALAQGGHGSLGYLARNIRSIAKAAFSKLEP